MQAGEKLFSGPCARQMVEYHLLGIQQIDPKKWDVFVLTKKSFKFPEDSPVLCQVSIWAYLPKEGIKS